MPEKRQTGHHHSGVPDGAGSLPGAAVEEHRRQLEIAPAAQIIVDKSRGRLAISSTRLVYPLPLGIYVAKGNTELAEAIKATLAALKANGQYAALIKKYNLESID